MGRQIRSWLTKTNVLPSEDRTSSLEPVCHSGLLGRTELPIPRYLSGTNFTLEPSIPASRLPVSANGADGLHQAGSVQSTKAAARIGRRTIWFTRKGLRYINMQFSWSSWHMLCGNSGRITLSQSVVRMMCAILFVGLGKRVRHPVANTNETSGGRQAHDYRQF